MRKNHEFRVTAAAPSCPAMRDAINRLLHEIIVSSRGSQRSALDRRERIVFRWISVVAAVALTRQVAGL